MVELPVVLLVAPVAVLVVMASRVRRRMPARGAVVVVSCVGVGALVVPVLITTAGGQETEAFAITYLLAAAFAVDLGWSGWRSARRQRS